MRMTKKEKIIISTISAVIIVAVIAIILLIVNNKLLATTMRLLKVEGTVNIEDASGTVKPVIDNIRFQSGDTLSTGADGLASIGLDDTKIVTLQNDSSAQFIKNGKQIELKLKQGGVFFEVTEKLTDDETYEIETSNMTVGIRGTSGYVWYDESGLQSLVITDGKVLVSGYNPQTGETKTVEVCGGQKVSCYLYSDKTQDRDSIEFELKDLDEEELPEFPLQMLAENPELMEKVCAETGWDKDKLLDLVNAILDPNTPSPTPDAIIEITDTPTAAPTATEALLLLITPTTSPTPTPKPTNPLSVINNVINDMIPDPTGTPEPSTAPEAPTPTPATTPVTTSAPIPTVTPTDEVTPTPTDDPVDIVTPTPTEEITPVPTDDPSPSLPDGYSKHDDAWAVGYEDHAVYICSSGDSYLGWYDNEWKELRADIRVANDGGSTYYSFYCTDSDGNEFLYYKCSHKVNKDWGVDSEPDVRDGCTKDEDLWGTTYDNHKVYVCYYEISDTGVSDPVNGSSWETYEIFYYGYANGVWKELTSEYVYNDQLGKYVYLYYYMDGNSKVNYCESN